MAQPFASSFNKTYNMLKNTYDSRSSFAVGGDKDGN
jgi:hypothetical protein